MGQAVRLLDADAVRAIARVVLALADEHVFTGEGHWVVEELPDRTIKSASFDAHFRLQSDRVNWQTEEERTMVMVRFTAPGQPVGAATWSLWVRGVWPGRHERLPDASPFSSRKLRKRTTRSTGQSNNTARPIPWGDYEKVWLNQPLNRKEADDQVVDVRAQVALFLLQTNIVPTDSAVRDDLIAYLRKTFRWRRIDDPDTAVYEVYEHLLTHKWWPDDWRGWRKFVRACIDGLIRGRRYNAERKLCLAPDQDGYLTVDQFAIFCHMPRSTAYELVRRGDVCSVRRDRDDRTMILSTEAERIRRRVLRRDVIAMAQAQGRSHSSARKWVYRQECAGRTLDEIARSLFVSRKQSA
jgi:hypothetical protein